MLTTLGVRELHAIGGFSSGAYRAFDLVLRREIPTRVVVGIGAMATFDDDAREVRRMFVRELEADSGFLGRPETRAMIREIMLAPSASNEAVAAVAKWDQNTTAAALVGELRALASTRDVRPELPRLHARLYLRVGELDVSCPPRTSHEIARLVPGAIVDVVGGCGHSLLIEDPEPTLEAIVRHIELS